MATAVIGIVLLPDVASLLIEIVPEQFCAELGRKRKVTLTVPRGATAKDADPTILVALLAHGATDAGDVQIRGAIVRDGHGLIGRVLADGDIPKIQVAAERDDAGWRCRWRWCRR